VQAQILPHPEPHRGGRRVGAERLQPRAVLAVTLDPGLDDPVARLLRRRRAFSPLL